MRSLSPVAVTHLFHLELCPAQRVLLRSLVPVAVAHLALNCALQATSRPHLSGARSTSSFLGMEPAPISQVQQQYHPPRVHSHNQQQQQQ
jgi:hypothetical protein